MNHDATHCYDYDPEECPKDCYRAELTEELRRINYPWPVSWSMFKYTDYCPKWPVKNVEETLKTGSCPLCDKTTTIYSNRNYTHCATCGHHLVLRKVDED